MISEFQQISQKIMQLALLAQHLRSENAELRLQLAQLRAENESCKARMQQAGERVAALLDKLPPAAENDQEIAANDGLEEEIA